MKRVLGVMAMGAAGLVLAVALSMGAFALAGKAVGEPASSIKISTPVPAGHSPHEGGSAPTTRPASPTPTDDHSSTSPSTSLGNAGSSEPGDGHGGGGHGSDD